MVKWEVHAKWATKMGISAQASKTVESLIDFPKKHKEFQHYCSTNLETTIYTHGKPSKMHIGQLICHDGPRSKEYAREAELSFLKIKGNEYIRAFYLHHLLDYIKRLIGNSAEIYSNAHETLKDKHIANNIGLPEEENLQQVIVFVKTNWNEILSDIKKEIRIPD